MIISTKGRYALRVMIDLAEHSQNSDRKYIPMKDVAERQKISLKYLEKILPPLAKNNYIVGVHGKGGGYRLTKSPDEYRVGDILRVTESEGALTACKDCHSGKCALVNVCRTRPMWDEFQNIVNNYLDGITVADLMKNDSLDII